MSKHFKPKTRGYYEIWVDGERAVSAVPAADTGQPAATPTEEPLYGEVYLPRKFKIVDLGDWCHTVGVDVLPVELGTEQWVRARRGRAGS